MDWDRVTAQKNTEKSFEGAKDRHATLGYQLRSQFSSGTERADLHRLLSAGFFGTGPRRLCSQLSTLSQKFWDLLLRKPPGNPLDDLPGGVVQSQTSDCGRLLPSSSRKLCGSCRLSLPALPDQSRHVRLDLTAPVLTPRYVFLNPVFDSCFQRNVSYGGIMYLPFGPRL